MLHYILLHVNKWSLLQSDLSSWGLCKNIHRVFLATVQQWFPVFFDVFQLPSLICRPGILQRPPKQVWPLLSFTKVIQPCHQLYTPETKYISSKLFVRRRVGKLQRRVKQETQYTSICETLKEQMCDGRAKRKKEREKILPLKELKAGSCLLSYLFAKVSIVIQGHKRQLNLPFPVMVYNTCACSSLPIWSPISCLN